MGYVLSKEQEIKREREIRDRPANFLEVTFQVTDECNFRCDYCYETKHNHKMTKDIVKRTIDLLFPIDDKFWGGYFLNTPEKDEISFNFFGGECLLEIDLITYAVDYFLEKCDEAIEKAKKENNEKDAAMYQSWKDRFWFTLQSNGYLVREPKVVALLDRFAPHMTKNDPFPKRRVRMFITLDGTKKTHDAHRKLRDSGKGTWDVVSENIKWFIKRYDYIPETKGTILPDTVSDLYDSYLAYLDCGFIAPRITLAESTHKWTNEEMSVLDSQLKKIYTFLISPENTEYRFPSWQQMDIQDECIGIGSCGVNGAQFAVETNGKIYCCFHFTPLSIPEWVREDTSIGDIWNGITEKGKEFIEKMRNLIDEYKIENEKCNTCVYFHNCGSCPANNYFSTGDVNKGKHLDCEPSKIMYKRGMIYAYEMEEKYGIQINQRTIK